MSFKFQPAEERDGGAPVQLVPVSREGGGGAVMGGEKRGSKHGGFFNLFDWNRKSRKKLFNDSADTEAAPAEAKKNQIKLLGDDDLQTARFHQAAGTREDMKAGVWTGGGSSPGVVARLMGLESVPSSSRRPSSTEWRTQKTPSSPVEKFQREGMPAKSISSVGLQRKLLSPMKTHGFISAENAAHIMEAAAKIIEPTLQMDVAGRASSPLISARGGGGSNGGRGSRMEDFQRRRRPSITDSTQRPLRSENSSSSRKRLSLDSSSSTACSSMPPPPPKSISLAMQAKANVKRREESRGVSSCNATTVAENDYQECQQKQQPLRSVQGNLQKNMNQRKKPSPPNSSSNSTVLRQNNQKQNSMASREKLASNHPVLFDQQHGIKAATGKTRNKPSSGVLNGKNTGKREGIECIENGLKEVFCSSNNKIARQANKSIQAVAKKSRTCSSLSVDEEHSRWEADVVSFTFNSAIRKPSEGSVSCDSSSSLAEDNNHMRNGVAGLKVEDDHDLGNLLEKKLRELESGSASKRFFDSARAASPADSGVSLCSEISSANGLALGRQARKELKGIEEELDCFSSNRSNPRHLLQPLHEDVSEDCDNARKGFHRLLPSDCSSSSIEECSSSSDSFRTIKGSKTLASSSVRAQDTAGNGGGAPATETELTDSASSRKEEKKDDDAASSSKVLLDCMNERLEKKHSRYFRAGYRAWAKGMAVVGREVADELDREMSRWKKKVTGEEEFAVDDVVWRDMSSGFGRWVDFEVEAFEGGLEVEREILASLVDELVADFAADEQHRRRAAVGFPWIIAEGRRRG